MQHPKKKRPSAQKQGYDAEWRRVRAQVLRDNPFCQFCGAPAEQVDHIQRLSERPDLRLDPSNLRALCHSCHSKRTHRDHSPFARDISCDEKGMPLGEDHWWNKKK